MTHSPLCQTRDPWAQTGHTQVMIKLVATGAAILFAVTACSSPDASDAPPTASPSASETPQMLPPVEVNGRANLTVDVGATINVTTPDVEQVTTNNSTVLDVSQPRDDGSAQFNAGAKVIAPGEANLKVYGPDETLLYTVAVTAQVAATSAPIPSETMEPAPSETPQ